MKTKYLLPALALAFTAFGLSSCEDMLETHYLGGTQDETQIKETIDANPSRINSTVGGMYALLNQPLGYANDGVHSDFGYPSLAMYQDLGGPDITNIVSDYDHFTPSIDWSDRNPNYWVPFLRVTLLNNLLYAAQEVINSVDANTTNPEAMAALGQGYAMRAFAYLAMAPYFQFSYIGNEDAPSVPMMLDGVDQRNNPRVPQRVLYNSMLEDLTEAIRLLDGFTRTSKDVIDQNVAYGIRARVNLNMGNWDAAVADADSALIGYGPYTYTEIAANPGFNNSKDLEGHTPHWIWACIIPVDIIGSAKCSWPAQIGSFSNSSYSAKFGIYRMINKLLWDKIPATDVRRAWWLDENLYSPYLENLAWTDPKSGAVYTGTDIPAAEIPNFKQKMTPYTNVKFVGAAGVGGATNEGDWCMMRAEEMILIKAEALAQAGDVGAGQAVLAALMAERDPEYATAPKCPNFIDEVWKQRRIELWGEGFSMSDIIRLNKPMVRFHEGDTTTNVTEVYRFNVAPKDPYILLRFVDTEIDNNLAVVQNEGGQQPKQGDGAGLLDGVTD